MNFELPEIGIKHVEEEPDATGIYNNYYNIIKIGVAHEVYSRDFGHVRVGMSEDSWVNVLNHEICHWAQFTLLDEEMIQSVCSSYILTRKRLHIIERAMPKEYWNTNTPLEVKEYLS